MPTVNVQMWEGRTVEQKRALVRAMTDAMIEHAGAKPDCLFVFIQEYAMDNTARGGTLGVDEVGE